MAAERPILFSGPMVQAILAGAKTQTRRIVRTLPNRLRPNCFIGMSGDRWCFTGGDRGGDVCGIRCPFGAPGDRLWVRETFYCDHVAYPDAPIEEMKPLLYYREESGIENAGRAGDNCYTGFSLETMRAPWRPSIHMPRWASRITLEVLDVRVERLQEIGEEDAAAEGVSMTDVLRAKVPTRRDAFYLLWDGINGKRAPWASNPWVWVVIFRRVA